MPESKIRKEAAEKKKAKNIAETSERRATKARLAHDRTWVPWVFIPVGLLGVIWMVVYNLAGNQIGFMTALGGWNIIIGLGLFMAAFGIATLWK